MANSNTQKKLKSIDVWDKPCIGFFSVFPSRDLPAQVSEKSITLRIKLFKSTEEIPVQPHTSLYMTGARWTTTVA